MWCAQSVFTAMRFQCCWKQTKTIVRFIDWFILFFAKSFTRMLTRIAWNPFPGWSSTIIVCLWNKRFSYCSIFYFPYTHADNGISTTTQAWDIITKETTVYMVGIILMVSNCIFIVNVYFICCANTIKTIWLELVYCQSIMLTNYCNRKP